MLDFFCKAMNGRFHVFCRHFLKFHGFKAQAFQPQELFPPGIVEVHAVGLHKGKGHEADAPPGRDFAV